MWEYGYLCFSYGCIVPHYIASVINFSTSPFFLDIFELLQCCKNNLISIILTCASLGVGELAKSGNAGLKG